MRPDASRDEGLRELGVHARLQRIAYASPGVPRPYEERKSLFADYKVELKKDKKRLAHELHPDRNEDLPQDQRDKRQQKFNRVIRAINFVLDNLNVRPPPAPRPQRRVVYNILMVHPTVVVFTGTSTTTNTAAYWGDIIK